MSRLWIQGRETEDQLERNTRLAATSSEDDLGQIDLLQNRFRQNRVLLKAIE
jgi:hypothetical protein